MGFTVNPKKKEEIFFSKLKIIIFVIFHKKAKKILIKIKIFN